jgi:vitamin B12 transporter
MYGANMSNLFQPTTLVGAIALAMGFSTSVSAQDSSNVVNASLDTLVVTATRSEEKIKDVPARISIIEPQIVEQSPIASLPDLLMTDPAINMVQSGGYGQISSIFLRGTNSNQTLVLRDGVRLNSATTGTASLPFIDTTDIQQIEVLKGPASVLYGTDAIGGVVQLVSKTPEKNSAFVTGEIGENATYKTLLGADLAENGFYAQIRGQHLETDGTPVKDSKNALDAAFDQTGYSAKIGIDKELYALSLDYSENEGNSQYDNYGAVANQDFKNEIVNLKGRVNITPNVEVNARVSQFKDDIDQNDQNYLGTYDFVHSTTQEAELYSKWQFTPSQNILVGTTFQNIDGDVISWGSPYAADVDSQGYYVQHQYLANGLSTQAGLRVEDNEKYGTHTIGQIAARYQVLPLTSIYTNIGTAFRSPTLNELYSAYGNPDLKPEESTSFEIGLDQNLNYGFTAGISLYRTEVENLIDATSVTGYIFQNIDQATFEGSEVYLKWQGENLYVNAGYNYVRAKNDKTDEDLSRRPRQNTTLTTGWQDHKFGFSTTLMASSSYDNSAYDNLTIPGHLRIDMNGYYNLNQAVKLFANIQNIGDSNYRTAYGSGSYYINGGRLASAGVTFRY